MLSKTTNLFHQSFEQTSNSLQNVRDNNDFADNAK